MKKKHKKDRLNPQRILATGILYFNGLVIKVIRGNAKVCKYKLTFFVQNNPTFN